MKYQITHLTTYTYQQPVTLQPHLVRLRPASSACQTLHAFNLQVSPQPIGLSTIVDLDGNAIVKLWFTPDPTQQLRIQTDSIVETHRDNPFDFLLEAWATHLPIDYPLSLVTQLRPYLGDPLSGNLDPVAVTLAQQLLQTTQNNPVAFLSELNQQIYQTCQHMIRETGDPLPPGITWNQKLGSCRDLAVLFMETCRAAGLATRFVSGYWEGDLTKQEERHLHGWAEVYLPGAGWRGYDPTHGLAVGDRHITLVTSPIPRYTAPVSGAYGPGKIQATLQYHLTLQIL